jgi:hypothetical protein
MSGSRWPVADSFGDPLLRRWLLGRLFNSWPRPPAFEPHQPPYLKAIAQTASQAAAPAYADLADRAPAAALLLDLPGCTIQLSPSDPGLLFRQVAGSPAREMAHSFAWLELSPGIEPAWVAALWRAWVDGYGKINPDRPEYQPRVAARRAVAILDCARRIGLPGPRDQTLALLRGHADLIRAKLDWWGADATDSKIVIEGHALYRLGLELGIAWAAESGFAILTEEAKRLILPSGVLAEDSIPRHLMITRAYADSWLAALRHQSADAAVLEISLRRLLGSIGPLTLPGGLPLVGEVPVWNPPSHFSGFTPGSDGSQGWTGLLPKDERDRLAAVRDSSQVFDVDTIAADGWLRFDAAGWNGLWHVAGWISAHGHADLGAPELHYQGVPIFIDPGGTDPFMPNQAAYWRSAAGHGGITLDGQDFYPRARPFYDAGFRAKAGGRPPVATIDYDSVTLRAFGPSPLGGPQELRRHWQFEKTGMAITDRFIGTGRFALVRRLVTPWPVMKAGDGSAVIDAGALRLSVRSDIPVTLRTGRRQDATGRERPTGLITFAMERAPLPWHGRIDIQIL